MPQRRATRRATRRALLASAAPMLLALPLAAQSPDGAHPSSRVDTARTFFQRRDLALAGAALAGGALMSAFDARVARWAASPGVQDGRSRHRVMQDLSDLTGETTLTWITVGGYGIGRLAGAGTLADVSLHLIEAQALTSVTGQLVRGVLGRARPSVDPGEQYAFHWGQGFGKFAYRSFPSLHSAAGFVVASGVVEEMRVRGASAAPYLAPLLYAAALTPGVTRMYLGQHWTSDVVTGAVLGTFYGARVVRYAHTHRRNRLDRMLLGARAAPLGARGLAVSMPLD